MASPLAMAMAMARGGVFLCGPVSRLTRITASPAARIPAIAIGERDSPRITPTSTGTAPERTAVIGDTIPICPWASAAYSRPIPKAPTAPEVTPTHTDSLDKTPGTTSKARIVIRTPPAG